MLKGTVDDSLTWLISAWFDYEINHLKMKGIAYVYLYLNVFSTVQIDMTFKGLLGLLGFIFGLL